ncbi:hypothetical protein GCM10018793_10550 [Streptomyces sulfonofaciens]|uniref:Glycosyl hydrolase family 95 N-terminal domain-containing protein n=1 Tax=Streptomyces sulfonofaciens TaxID=68272 RepID=A0A919FUJ6_9ACTN|nr:hypothetical protein GCM10018793_10550 [Streptomyces sulfonofaciens]
MPHGPTGRATMKSAVGGAGALAVSAGIQGGTAAAAEGPPDTSDDPVPGPADPAGPAGDPALWYTAPAADWEREALPIGNGALGAMVFGTLAAEHLQVNEKTLWTGGPGTAGGYDHGNWSEPRPDALASVQRQLDENTTLSPEEAVARLGGPRRGYGAHQTLGDLYLDLPGAPAAVPEDYRRALHLAAGTATVAYTDQGVRHAREFFASHPDGVLVGRLTADLPGRTGCTLRYASPRTDFTATAAGDRITVRGTLADNGMRFEAQLRLRHRGGSLTAGDDGSLTLTGADEAWFVLAAGTDYADTHPSYRGDDPHRSVTRTVDAAAGRPVAELRARHVADHRALFDRVRLDVGQGAPVRVPTDRLLADYTGGPGEADRALEALFFQYGRYLLIASSRTGTLPANLQGLWNQSTQPPWSADYHVNINLQMNYWPAEAAALPETTAPYDRFVRALREPGRRTAREMFGSRGWVVHDETNPFGFTGVHDWPTSFWFPEAAAWLTAQLYEHYRFGGSTEYLRTTAYPVMKEAAEFWLDNLHTDPRDGTLVVSPSYSPEHGDFSAGASMSQQIVHDLFTNTLEAAGTLGDSAAFRAELEAALAALDPGLRIGSWGQLQEWKTDLDVRTDDHRHVSHLYALHPGRAIRPGSDWAEAAKVSLTARGDGGTGWSKAWKINFWARLRDGDHSPPDAQRATEVLHAAEPVGHPPPVPDRRQLRCHRRDRGDAAAEPVRRHRGAARAARGLAAGLGARTARPRRR